MDLIAIEQLKQLKHRYFRTLDLKQWPQFGDCLTDDVQARYGTRAAGDPLHFEGRTSVVAYMTENLPHSVITLHVAQHPEIEVDGDRAIGSWCFEDTVIATEFSATIRGGGYYRDEYVRESDGRWRIAATSYERIYEAMTSHADTPSFRLLANRWA